MTTSAIGSPPNLLVLEAQSRICTGPHQTRPLVSGDGPDPDAVLDHVIASASGLCADPASPAQIGAYLAAMTIRRGFPESTRWSRDEHQAVRRHAAALMSLPSPFVFLFDPDRPPPTSVPADSLLVKALQVVLAGDNLTYDHALSAAGAALAPDAHPALAAAFLIGQRMNRETYDEFCGHLDAVFHRSDVRPVDVDTLTHIGEPYNGSMRFFKSTLFVAAVRAAQGHASLLHGVDRLPPKFGVTEEQILQALGAAVDLDLDRTARLIEDPNVGFAYVSQRAFSPQAYAAGELRHHIGKRPPWAATEKAQRLLRAKNRNSSVIGYYHPGYESIQLRLMRDDGLDDGFLIKGEEGTSQFSLRPREPGPQGRQRVNHVEGFRGSHEVAEALDPTAYGFRYEASPRAKSATAETFAGQGRDALSGEVGAIFDRIVLNAAALNVLLGCDPDPATAVERVRDTITGGDALRRLDAYIARSHTV
jgi:anthranilate phosphoribosyltransferase